MATPKTPPSPDVVVDIVEASTVLSGGNRVRFMSVLFPVAMLCPWLPPTIAAFFLAMSAFSITYMLGVLAPFQIEDAKEGESREESQVALQSEKEATANADARRKKAVEGSTSDRDQLYRLRGELAALGGSEDRVKFLLAGSDAATLTKGKAQLQRDMVFACRECEDQRLEADRLSADVDTLKQRVRDLETEIEATLQQREAEHANREHLDEEKTKLRAQASRLQAKITAQDTQLQHNRKELQSHSGYAHAEQRRLEAEIASGLQVKRREVRNEEQARRLKEGEKRFVESCSERLYESLEGRTAQLKQLREKLHQEAVNKRNVELVIEGLKTDILEASAKAEEAARKHSDETADGPADASPMCNSSPSGPNPKPKASKSGKAKKRKDADNSVNRELEDLELEHAAVVAGREAAEKSAMQVTAAAEARVTQAKRHAEIMAKDCEEIQARLALIAKDREVIAVDQDKLKTSMDEQNAKISDMEKQIKDVERGKIRIRLDMKKIKDAKAKPETAKPECSMTERGSHSSQSAPKAGHIAKAQAEEVPSVNAAANAVEEASMAETSADITAETQNAEEAAKTEEVAATEPTVQSSEQAVIAEEAANNTEDVGKADAANADESGNHEAAPWAVEDAGMADEAAQSTEETKKEEEAANAEEAGMADAVAGAVEETWTAEHSAEVRDVEEAQPADHSKEADADTAADHGSPSLNADQVADADT